MGTPIRMNGVKGRSYKYPVPYFQQYCVPQMSRLLVQSVGIVTAVVLQSRGAHGAPSWSSVAIGGGGYVLQTFFSSVDSNVYMKTDVGGIYRR
jgi:hypothetical protein